VELDVTKPVRTLLPVQLLPADSGVKGGEEPEELPAQRGWTFASERLEVYWQADVLMPVGESRVASGAYHASVELPHLEADLTLQGRARARPLTVSNRQHQIIQLVWPTFLIAFNVAFYLLAIHIPCSGIHKLNLFEYGHKT
jgi:hypothetical protein